MQRHPAHTRSTLSRRITQRIARRLAAAARCCALVLLCAAASTAVVQAQTEPEAPRAPEKLMNGWQLSGWVGGSYNVFSGGYYDDESNISFIADETSTSMPFGVSLNVPVFEDASLYLRAGWHRTETSFFTGRYDSLRSRTGQGEIGDELTVYYSMLTFDVLIRLIGRQDGERVYFGPSFGIVDTRRARVVETEYPTGAKYLFSDRDIESAHGVRRSFVIGAEYAFVPHKAIYIIPAIEIDYALQKLSTVQPLKPTFYKFLLSIAIQPF